MRRTARVRRSGSFFAYLPRVDPVAAYSEQQSAVLPPSHVAGGGDLLRKIEGRQQLKTRTIGFGGKHDGACRRQSDDD